MCTSASRPALVAWATARRASRCLPATLPRSGSLYAFSQLRSRRTATRKSWRRFRIVGMVEAMSLLLRLVQQAQRHLARGALDRLLEEFGDGGFVGHRLSRRRPIIAETASAVSSPASRRHTAVTRGGSMPSWSWIGTPLGGALVSLLLGLLLGLERQHAKHGQAFAGIRTFPLFALSGFFAGLAAQKGVPLALPAVLLAVGAFGVASYFRDRDRDAGITTEMTGLLSALLGAMVALGEATTAAASAVVVLLLLTLKAPLHRVAGKVSEEEILAIVKFGIVAVVLVPLLPDRPMGPYGALVPRKVGLLVVILSGVSLAGYLMVKLLGERAGWAVAGGLGGLVSSTATTLSFAGKARAAHEQVAALAVGVILASTVLYARGAVVVALLDRELALHLAPRLAVLFGIGAVFAALQYRRQKSEHGRGDGAGEPGRAGPRGDDGLDLRRRDRRGARGAGAHGHGRAVGRRRHRRAGGRGLGGGGGGASPPGRVGLRRGRRRRVSAGHRFQPRLQGWRGRGGGRSRAGPARAPRLRHAGRRHRRDAGRLAVGRFL